METALLLTINLRGKLSGPVEHNEKQSFTIDVSPLGAKYPEWITRKIKHVDRTIIPCSRKVRISETALNFWCGSDCPRWEKSNHWKAMSRQQKIQSYIKSFDEGYGVKYEFIN